MKKLSFLTWLLFFSPIKLLADHLNVKIIPGYSNVSLETTPSLREEECPLLKNNLDFGVGIAYDIAFSENYYFSTGLLYMGRKLSLTHPELKKTLKTQNIVKENSLGEEHHSLVYFEVPAMLKLYTSEFSLDTRGYFQLGGSFLLRLDSRIDLKNTKDRLVNSLNWIDYGLSFSTGVEYEIGTHTAVFMGIGYRKGFANLLKGEINPKGLSLRYNTINLELGVRC